MALIELKNVSLFYENMTVLSNLSFSINQGDYLCIVGENGSGKSTLIKALLNLKHIKKGEIIFGDGLKAGQIGYLPQQSGNQKDFPASVKEVILSGTVSGHKISPFYSKAEKETAMLNMKKLDIEDIAKRPFSELSGGQQQRVMLARALCATKKLLILDEPVTGLDPIVTSEFYDLIKKINDEGITVIMVSHDISCAVKYASHILHLQNEPLFFGKTEDYVTSDAGKRFMGGASNV